MMRKRHLRAPDAGPPPHDPPDPAAARPAIPPRRRKPMAGAAWVALGAGGLWWVLAGPEKALHPLGALAVLLAAAASLALPPGRATGMRMVAVPGLVGFFLRASLVGGVDVAWRAIHPRLPIRPGFVQYRCHLLHGPPLTLFMGIVSLLPGTLSVRLEGRLLTVHVLDLRSRPSDALGALERRVAALFPSPRPGQRAGEEG